MKKRLISPVEILGYIALAILCFTVLQLLTVKPTKADTVLPPPFEGLTLTDDILETTLTHANTATGELTTTVFSFPNIIFDGTRDVTFITKSPLDPNRSLDDLPNAPLALFHYWIMKQQLFRAQLIYADCVGAIKAHQRRLGMSPLIDEPGALKDVVTATRDYVIPFNPIPHPLTKEDIIAHTKAAIDTVNITVVHIGLCRLTLSLFE